MFHTRPDRSCGPPSLLKNGYRVSFLGVKRSGRGVDHPPPVSAEVKERVELYMYFLSWAFMACSRANFTFTLISVIILLSCCVCCRIEMLPVACLQFPLPLPRIANSHCFSSENSKQMAHTLICVSCREQLPQVL